MRRRMKIKRSKRREQKEYSRRKEKEELETEVVKLRRRLEDVEIPFKEEVNLNLHNLVKVNVNCSR